MISMALTFGAPDNVPAGRTLISALIGFSSSLNSPCTSLTKCVTLEYFSTVIKFFTSTVPNLLTFPTSFLPRSTNIVCSALSFGSLTNCLTNISSSSFVFPLGTVPAIGLVATIPFKTLTNFSGEAPTT